MTTGPFLYAMVGCPNSMEITYRRTVKSGDVGSKILFGLAKTETGRVRQRKICRKIPTRTPPPLLRRPLTARYLCLVLFSALLLSGEQDYFLARPHEFFP